jgi:hypothetical protein
MPDFTHAGAAQIIRRSGGPATANPVSWDGGECRRAAKAANLVASWFAAFCHNLEQYHWTRFAWLAKRITIKCASKSQSPDRFSIVRYDNAMTRVLMISDIHANLAALESVLAAASGRYDTLWCLGDVVGYGPKPNECIELVRERAALCVMGNHDWAVLGRPGINVDDFNPQARQAVLWTRAQLTPANRAYLEALPVTPVHPQGAAERFWSPMPARASRCGNTS